MCVFSHFLLCAFIRVVTLSLFDCTWNRETKDILQEWWRPRNQGVWANIIQKTRHQLVV